MSFFYAIAVVSLAVMFPILLSLRKTDVPGTASFCAACTLSALSSGLVLTADIAPLWFHAVIGSTVMIAGCLMTLRGFRQFLGRRPVGLAYTAWALVFTAGVLGCFSYGVDSAVARISFGAGLAGVIHFLMGAAILRHWPRKPAITPYMLFCAVAAFTVASLHLLRVITVTADFDGFGGTNAPYIWTTALQAARSLIVPLFFLGIILMLHGWMIAHLRHMIAHDDLTGALSRRAFLAQYDRLFASASGSGRQTAFMLLDLDRFKQINDRHGHAGGDAALAHFARTVSDTLGARGILGRLGGEEFGIALDNIGGLEAADIAGAICTAVRSTPTGTVKGVDIALTVSIGLAMGEPGGTVADVMVRADVALYEAKALGRDQVRVADSPQQASAASARALAGAAAQMRAATVTAAALSETG